MKNSISFLTVTCLMLICQSCVSQSSVFTNDSKIALGGYDVVAYHTAHEAVRGSKTYSVESNGATYYFSSAENQKAFKEEAKKYLPKYGGYCAFGMAMQGAQVPTNPTTFKIRDGELYFFFNDFYEGNPFNTIVPWNQGKEADLIKKADANWKNAK